MTATLATTDPTLLEFADLVGDSGAVSVAGGRTRWHLGGELEHDARIISAPVGIVDYEPAEMTVTVRAGTPVDVLHGVLAEQGQRTALPERGGTVGGALAAGENDHRASGRGMLRTAPLQVRYVSAEGRIVSSGGPTVKNVSGFDLPRLMVGSLGTLGLLAEVILRTNPIPPVSRWLVAADADPRATFDALLAPSCVLWDGSNTWVQLEGHGPDVDAQTVVLASTGSFAETDTPPLLPAHRWSLPPKFEGSPTPGVGEPSNFVDVVGFGLRFADEPQPPRTLDPAVAEVHRRIKANFDPTGRLNPGRDPAAR